MVGVNLPEMVVQLMEGKPVATKLTYPIGQMYVRYVEELITPISNFNKLISKKEL
jgi:carbamoyl-phosphate synthase large subunit